MSNPVLSASALLSLSARGLDEAADTAAPGQRYALSHLAALRAAAAVLSCRAVSTGPAGSGSGRGRPKSVWVLLAAVAPELAEWAQFFAAGAQKRAAAEAGLGGVVTPREADDLLRDAQSFLALVETTLSISARSISARSISARSISARSISARSISARSRAG